MLEGVTIEQLRTLRAVAAEGSFSAAARKLGRVQAGVSQAIDRLEAQLGLQLFDRTGRVPRLTAHGEAIVATAGKVQSGLEELDEVVASLKRGVERTLSIVVDVLFPTTSLVSFVKELARVHPQVGLSLHTALLSGVTAHVRDRRASWGIAVEDADLTGLERRPIADVRLVPVAARTHALARQAAPLDGEALATAVQIVQGAHHAATEMAPEGVDHGVLSPRTWRVVDLATKHALIAGGLGWGHMPEHLIRDDLRRGALVELRLQAWGEVSLRRALVLVWRREAVLGPVARWAQERLSDLCQRVVEPPGAAISSSDASHHTRPSGRRPAR
jgi:DNA-binding transcriptional LysR family regulator